MNFDKLKNNEFGHNQKNLNLYKIQKKSESFLPEKRKLPKESKMFITKKSKY